MFPAKTQATASACVFAGNREITLVEIGGRASTKSKKSGRNTDGRRDYLKKLKNSVTLVVNLIQNPSLLYPSSDAGWTGEKLALQMDRNLIRRLTQYLVSPVVATFYAPAAASERAFIFQPVIGEWDQIHRVRHRVRRRRRTQQVRPSPGQFSQLPSAQYRTPFEHEIPVAGLLKLRGALVAQKNKTGHDAHIIAAILARSQFKSRAAAIE